MQLACHQSIQLPVLDRVSALQLLFGCVGEVDFQRREQIELKYAELIVGHTGLDGYPLALAYVASFVRSQGQGYSLRNFWEMMNANKKYISTGPKRLQEFLKMCRLTKIESKLMGVGVNDLDSLRELIPSDLECTDIGPLDKRILLTARDELTNASSFSVWRLDIRAIWKSSLLAQRLLCFASLLPARDIPENLLLSCVDRMEMQCEPLAVRNVFDLIERHSLLTREGIQVYNENVYSGHLLVLGDIRQFAADEQEDLSIYLSVLCESLCSLLPLSVDVRQWLGLNDPKVQRYSLHLFHIANLCAEEKLLSAPPCQMLLDLACILGIRTRNIETATTLCQVRLQHAWSAGVLRTVATALVDMGRCFSLSYEKEPAMAHFCEALRLLEGQCMNNLDEWAIAVLEIARGHWDLGDGTTMMEQATKVKVVLEENQCTDRHLYAEALTNISMYWWHIGNYSEAKMTSLKAVAVYEKCLPLNHSLLAAEMDNLGSYCTAQAKFKDAKEWLERSIRIKPNCLPSSHPRIVNTLRLLGEMYNESGCFDEAERILREADRLASASYSTETQEAAWNRVTLGQCLSLKGKGKEGEQLVRQGVIQIMKMYGDKHLRTGLAQCMLGSCLTICGKTSEAETNLRDALQVVRQNLPENHHHIGTVWHELGQCYQRQSKYDEAKAAFTNALLIKKRSFVDDHPSLIQSAMALFVSAMD
jgi:tetratricopeptide (TPR) repeat protein